MLDKDDIISTSVSEPVEKVPTEEKDYLKCSIANAPYVLLCTTTAYKEKINI